MAVRHAANSAPIVVLWVTWFKIKFRLLGINMITASLHWSPGEVGILTEDTNGLSADYRIYFFFNAVEHMPDVALISQSDCISTLAVEWVRHLSPVIFNTATFMCRASMFPPGQPVNLSSQSFGCKWHVWTRTVTLQVWSIGFGSEHYLHWLIPAPLGWHFCVHLRVMLYQWCRFWMNKWLHIIFFPLAEENL